MQKKILKLFFMVTCFTASFVLADCPTAPVDISSGLTANQSQIGIDANGNAVAIWKEFDGANTYIKSATLPYLGTWSAPLTISTFAGPSAFSRPQVAVNPINGDAVAIWGEISNRIQTSTLPFGGVWTAPFELASSSQGRPQIAINPSNPSNYAVAVWEQRVAINHFIQSAYLQSGTWSSVINVVPSTPDNLEFPQVGIDNSGQAIAVWYNTTNSLIQSATLPMATPPWTTPVDVGSSNIIVPPALAVGNLGYAIAVWGFDNSSFIELRYSEYTGSWSAEQTFTFTESNTPAVAVDQAQNAMIIWSEQDPGPEFYVRAGYIVGAGNPITFSTLSTGGGDSSTPDVAFDVDGNAYAIWSKSAVGAIIEFSNFPVDTLTWSPRCPFSQTGESSLNPHIASYLSGYAVMDWNNATTNDVQASVFPQPPSLISIDPASGSTSGGNTVIINGDNFSDVTSVEFSPGNPAIFTIISSTQIIAIVPPSIPLNTPQVINVVVTSPGGEATITYTYVSPICWQR